jgi:hypothetical protein
MSDKRKQENTFHVGLSQRPLREVSLARLLLLVVLLLNSLGILFDGGLLFDTIKCFDVVHAQELGAFADREAGTTILDGHALELVLGLGNLGLGICGAAVGTKQLDTTRQTQVAEAEGTVTYMGLLSVAVDEVVQRALGEAALALANLGAGHGLLEAQGISASDTNHG